MAVIKIVPMPGAVGDKGDEGAVGPRGLQGEQGLQGAPGADALWNYNGAYNPGAGYAVGDVVTYNGQTWYRKNSNGGNVGDTPSQGIFWDLVAAKGADSIAPTSGTWDTKIAETSGIVGGSYASEDMKLGRYYTIGDLVFIEINFAVAQPSSWGDFGGFAGELPFPVAPGWQAGWNLNSARNYLQGRYYARADQEPFGFPYQEDEVGNYDMLAVLYNSAIDETPMFSIFTTDKESLNTNSESVRPITPEWPVNLNVSNNENSPYISFRFSGVYRKA
jgi:hypothetical protein